MRRHLSIAILGLAAFGVPVGAQPIPAWVVPPVFTQIHGAYSANQWADFHISGAHLRIRGPAEGAPEATLGVTCPSGHGAAVWIRWPYELAAGPHTVTLVPDDAEAIVDSWASDGTYVYRTGADAAAIVAVLEAASSIRVDLGYEPYTVFPVDGLGDALAGCP